MDTTGSLGSFCLVKYIDDSVLHIVQTKKLKLLENNLVSAPYKSLGYFKAVVITYSNTKHDLEDAKLKLLEETCKDGKKSYSDSESNFNQRHIDPKFEQSRIENDKKISVDYKALSNSKEGEIGIDNKLNISRINFSDRKESYTDGESDYKQRYVDLSSEQNTIERNKHKSIEYNALSDRKGGKTEDDNQLSKKNDIHSLNVKLEPFNRNKISSQSLQDKYYNEKNNESRCKTNFSNKKGPVILDQQIICYANDNRSDFQQGQDHGISLKDEQSHSEIEDRYIYKKQVAEPNAVHKTKNQQGRNSEKLKIQAHKKHYCCYCQKMLYQLPRHWFNVHTTEPEIRDIMQMHLSNPRRIDKINSLRKKCDFSFNKKSDGNQQIVVRKSKYENVQYLPCPNCMGYFSKDNIRHHRKRCCPAKNDRTALGRSRSLTNFSHPRASQALKRLVISSMFQDEISANFLFDEILILYGNYMCIKYTDAHLKNYIRAQLRLLGRFMMQAKTIDTSITCCKDLMHPVHIDTIRKAIDFVAGLDERRGTYQHPTNARTLGTEFKKILEVVKSEADKIEDDNLMKLTNALSRLYKLELAPYINRICKRSENKYRRNKQSANLPESDEIEKSLNYLMENIGFVSRKLKSQYSFEIWNKLCQYTLVALAVLNRKRPGETQRIEIEDYYERESVSEKDFHVLSDPEKTQAAKYVRVAFRGKLGNPTALLIDKAVILPAIEIILKYRLQAGVSPNNIYLFGYPSNTDFDKTFDTYRCNRLLLSCSGINSTSLKFTLLRKQFVTQVAKSDPSQADELRISNYMSHDYNIHKRIYDQSTSLIDITRVSKHLEKSSSNANPKIQPSRILPHQSNLSYNTESDNHNQMGNIELGHCSAKSLAGKATESKGIGKNFFKKTTKHNSDLEKTLMHSSSNAESEIESNMKANFKSCHTNESSTEATKVSNYIGQSHQNKSPLSNVNLKTNFPQSSLALSSSHKKKKMKRKYSSDDYICNTTSTESEDELDLDQVEKCIGKFRKRRLWSSEERKLTRNYFKKEIEEKEYVSRIKIKQFQEKNVSMRSRSIDMIRQWLEREIKKNIDAEDGIIEKRPRYSTPEKQILESSTERHSLDRSDPFILEMENLIKTYPVLSRRNASALLGYVKRRLSSKENRQ